MVSLQPVDRKKPVKTRFSPPKVCYEDNCNKDCEALGWRVRVRREDKPLQSSLRSERNAGVPAVVVPRPAETLISKACHRHSRGFVSASEIPKKRNCRLGVQPNF